jgi:diadenosine tetraphosphate (Ap4A) HIT family hydrolase/protein-tyrosine-phosphatase
MKRILFLCTGNIARSQMAEALMRFHGGDRFRPSSAGTRPGSAVPAETIEVLREIGVPVDDPRSKHADEFGGEVFDVVVTVCDSARQECPTFPGKRVLHWDIEDPSVAMGDGATRLEAFRKARNEIQRRIKAFLAGEGCVFCAILAGEATASFIHQDDLVCAFMDIRPVNPGHALVIPREHAASLDEVAPEAAERMMSVAQRIAAALPATGVRMDGYNLFLADGVEAGQEVFHSHLHIIPRFEDDGFGLKFAPGYGRIAPRDELDEQAGAVRSALGG